MKNIYQEIKPELRYVADTLEDHKFTYCAYNNGVQYNAEDRSGIVHSYYPTKGTIVFNHSNDRYDNIKLSLKDKDLDTFMDYLDHPERIQKLFEQ